MASPGSGGTFVRTFLKKYYPQDNLECNKAAEIIKGFTQNKFIAHHICLAAESIKSNTDYKIIHLVRNGYDSTDSWLQKKMLDELDLQDKEKHVKFAKIWELEMKETQKIKDYENYLEIKYEDLCLNPEKIIKQIEVFLEVNNTESLINLKSQLVPSIGKSKELDKEIIKDISPIINPINKELGYEN